MKHKRLLTMVSLSLGVILAVGLFVLVGQAAPGSPVLNPPRNSHSAPLTTTISITYDEPISAATVTSRTFAVYAMQSGLITTMHTVSGNMIIVTPTQPFHQGELVYAIATTRTLSISGTEPLSATQWQFHAGKVVSRCVGRFIDVDVGVPDVSANSVDWGDYDHDGDLDILLTGSTENNTPVSRIYRNDAGSFTDIDAGLPGVSPGSAVWGDYDSDGDLDLLLAGRGPLNNRVAYIYRNDAASFTDIGAGLPGIAYGTTAWGDYDNDGDLDILLTGNSGGNPVSLVYRNDAGSFTNIGAGLPGVLQSSAAWGDYDNDGDLDLLLAGTDSSWQNFSEIFRNDGQSFTDINAGLPGAASGSVAWGDYDDDGDLDILLTGQTNTDLVASIYRNESGSFQSVSTDLPGVSDGNAMWGDYDNDGHLDILISGRTMSGTYLSQVYHNDTGSFTSVDAGLPGVSGLATWGDYDGDDDLDILFVGWQWFTPLFRIYRNDDCSSDLALVKMVTPQMAAPGDAVTFTLAFSNVGSLPASHVVITDVIAVAITTPSYSSSVVVTPTGAISYTWEVTDLDPGESGTITVTGILSAGLPTGIVTNTATITSTSPNTDFRNNNSSVPLYVYTWYITETAPAANSVSVPPTTSVEVVFDGDLDVSTVTSTTLAIHGMMGGLMTGTYNYNSPNRALTVTPCRPFHTGEIAHISATDNMLRFDGEPLFAHQWQFRAGETTTRCVAGFTDIGAGLSGVYASSVAWGDYDSDGDLDILLTGWGNQIPISLIYRNDNGSFTSIGAGLPGFSTGSAAWGDYDNDGDLDILLVGRDNIDNRRSRIYRNDNGSFVNIGAGLPGVAYGSAAWGDYDNDGDLDIVLTGITESGYNISRIYRNDAGVFTEVAAGLPGVDWSSVAWGDYDNDGDLDILLAGSSVGGPMTVIYRNDFGSFTYIDAGLPRVPPRAIAWDDYDNDGDLDILFVANDGTTIYRNTDGTFGDIGAGMPGISGSAAWGDYDNDGDLDILLAGRTSTGTRISHIYRNDQGEFVNINAGLTGVERSSAAWGDYDHDGDLDILLTGLTENSSRVAQVYRNDDCVADLMLAKTVAPTVPAPGSVVTYTLAFSNTGTGIATGAIITDVVPISITNVSYTNSGAAITETGSISYTWQVEPLLPGNGGIITITGVLSPNLPAGYAFTNTAAITTTVIDADYSNNGDSAMVTTSDKTRCSLSPGAYSFNLTATVQITITTVGTLDCLTVERVDANHANATPAIQTGRYWMITGVDSGGAPASGYSLTLTLPTTFSPDTSDQVCRYTGSGTVWDCAVTSYDDVNNTITRGDVTLLSDWAVGNDVPTAVTLASFTATAQGGNILVTWETAIEIDNVGFNLHRSTSPDGSYFKLNETLIPSQAPGSIFGATYTWLDEDVEAGTTYYYKLEDVEVGGRRTFHGPVAAQPAEPTALLLRSFGIRGSPAAALLMLLGAWGLVFIWLIRKRR
jgi:uncharacterized repeat protein (TIGR01451 family)